MATTAFTVAPKLMVLGSTQTSEQSPVCARIVLSCLFVARI